MRSLIDTGASCSLISNHLAVTIPNIKIDRGHTSQRLIGVEGSYLKIKGTTRLTFKLGNHHLSHTFVVCDNIGHSMILGRDFLTTHKVVIRYDNPSI